MTFLSICRWYLTGGVAPGLRITERGQLMEYFCEKINAARVVTRFSQMSMPRMGKILQAIPTSNLYYLKRVWDDIHHNLKYCTRRGCSDVQHFSMKFVYELDPSKHGTVANNARTTCTLPDLKLMIKQARLEATEHICPQHRIHIVKDGKLRHELRIEVP